MKQTNKTKTQGRVSRLCKRDKHYKNTSNCSI